ncbi:hypothetical protein [Carboxylicivirga linearis]|uniref:Peptidylprolyl isomerase n=1 Tax=Carboxylicivirga linearis TaxID=1628157 RepID=A0ABS5JT03_9BACT|nr:hypothetical protein [Carboxylicivirga linearis]MBS2098046.1 hypothetical protein [Carboxylicivirga linearis]
MKKIYLTVLAAWVAVVSLSAQVSEQEANLMRSILKSEVKVFFAQNIKLKSSEANMFWEIYDLYEEELLPVGNRRVAILQEIVKGKGKLSEDDADRLINEAEKIDKQRKKVRWKYYKILKKKMSTSIAVQFYQLDAFIHSQVTAAINEGGALVIPVGDKKEE